MVKLDNPVDMIVTHIYYHVEFDVMNYLLNCNSNCVQLRNFKMSADQVFIALTDANRSYSKPIQGAKCIIWVLRQMESFDLMFY